ncbi:MAG: hypothetical protein NTW04_03710 [Elusimicrobia bacterium]|nr:hypothetical protein [Elusimicrobiota bacterium]
MKAKSCVCALGLLASTAILAVAITRPLKAYEYPAFCNAIHALSVYFDIEVTFEQIDNMTHFAGEVAVYIPPNENIGSQENKIYYGNNLWKNAKLLYPGDYVINVDILAWKRNIVSLNEKLESIKFDLTRFKNEKWVANIRANTTELIEAYILLQRHLAKSIENRVALYQTDERIKEKYPLFLENAPAIAKEIRDSTDAFEEAWKLGCNEASTN